MQFSEFWPMYVRAHQNPRNRAMHFVGTSMAIVLFALIVTTVLPIWTLILLPIVGYGFAWTGHFGMEGNKPATFGHPFLSLGSDFVMWFKILTRQMGKEVEKYPPKFPSSR